MKLKSLNKIPEKYGIAEFIDYTNESFKGHQIGFCIGDKNNVTGAMTSHLKSKDPNVSDEQLLEEFLKEGFFVLEDTINQVIEGKFVENAKTLYFVPYYVVDHSVYQPTPNFTNISFSQNVRNHVKYEVLFVDEQGWYNRYLTLECDTAGGNSICYGTSLSFLEIIEDLGKQLEEILQDEANDTITIQNDSITMTFYDKTGTAYPTEFSSIDEMLKLVTSVRMIDCVTEIIKD